MSGRNFFGPTAALAAALVLLGPAAAFAQAAATAPSPAPSAAPSAAPAPASAAPGENVVPAAPPLVSLVDIPAGGNTRGSYPNFIDIGLIDPIERDPNEMPAHTVVLKAFRLGKTEVTQLQYQTVTGRNPSRFRAGALAMFHPVENVCWFDAVLFCNLLSQREGLEPAYYADAGYTTVWLGQGVDVYWKRAAKGYRLPTEAEWEYAARAGNRKDLPFPGGAALADIAWFAGNSGTIDEDGLDAAFAEREGNWSHRVGLKAANAWGLYDMIGNVREWCWDWMGRYVNKLQNDPTGASWGNYRVLRGGAYASEPRQSIVTYRFQAMPGVRSALYGFRVARNAD